MKHGHSVLTAAVIALVAASAAFATGCLVAEPLRGVRNLTRSQFLALLEKSRDSLPSQLQGIDETYDVVSPEGAVEGHASLEISRDYSLDGHFTYVVESVLLSPVRQHRIVYRFGERFPHQLLSLTYSPNADGQPSAESTDGHAVEVTRDGRLRVRSTAGEELRGYDHELTLADLLAKPLWTALGAEPGALLTVHELNPMTLETRTVELTAHGPGSAAHHPLGPDLATLISGPEGQVEGFDDAGNLVLGCLPMGFELRRNVDQISVAERPVTGSSPCGE